MARRNRCPTPAVSHGGHAPGPIVLLSAWAKTSSHVERSNSRAALHACFRAHFMNPQTLQDWTATYLTAHRRALESIDTEKVAKLVGLAREIWLQDRQLFAFGNGGSAASASHFVTDLGKGASDKMSRAFRVLSLNDNVSWLTALGQ
jgi:hypothetical protein